MKLTKTYFKPILVLGILSLLNFSCGDLEDDEDEDGTPEISLQGSSGEVGASLLATEGISPSSLLLKVYSVEASESEYCTDLKPVFSNAAPEATDFAANPALGSGELAEGTYKCVAIEMSDNITFTPAEASDNGGCAADTAITIDVCRGDFEDDPENCDSGDNKIKIYLSTVSTNKESENESDMENQGSPFKAPTETALNQGFFLNGAFEVSGDKTGTFYADFNGKIRETGGDDDRPCDVMPPAWGFK